MANLLTKAEFLSELDNRAKAAGWGNREALASKAGLATSELVHFFRGSRGLSTYKVSNLAAALNLDPAPVLALWEYYQYCDKLAAEAAQPADGRDRKVEGLTRARDAFLALHSRFANAAATPSLHAGTLANWRHWLSPVLVFVGDRREEPPRSPADLLAASGSPGDLFYLPDLQLPAGANVVSDKSCIIAKPENFRSIVQDHHLLIVGSPAANLVAREANDGACFSFASTPEAIAFEREFKPKLEPIRYLSEELEKYLVRPGDEAGESEKEFARRRRGMISGFARTGLLDPVDFQGLRGTRTGARDYGVVSICRHPWSKDRLAIIAAGLHGPGTAAALKLLAEPGAFDQRPLGGVFWVNVPNEAPWEERYKHLRPNWDTHPYTIDSYLRSVAAFEQTRGEELKGPHGYWNPAHVREVVALVQQA